MTDVEQIIKVIHGCTVTVACLTMVCTIIILACCNKD